MFALVLHDDKVFGGVVSDVSIFVMHYFPRPQGPVEHSFGKHAV